MQNQIKKRIEAFANQIRSRQREDKKQQIRIGVIIEGMSNTIMDVCERMKKEVKEELRKEIWEGGEKGMDRGIERGNGDRSGDMGREIQSGLYLHQRISKIEEQMQVLQSRQEKISHQLDVEELESSIITKIAEKVQKNYASLEQTDVIIQKIKYLGEQLQILKQNIRNISEPPSPTPTPSASTLLAENWVDSSCTYFRVLKFTYQKITAKNSQVLVFSRYRVKGQYTYSVKVDRMNGTLCLGIASQEYKNKLSLRSEKNLIVYWNKGNIWDGYQWREGVNRGFREGDEIEVRTNFTSGKITWLLNSVKLYETNIKGLDFNVTWVPFIYLSSENDQISIKQPKP